MFVVIISNYKSKVNLTYKNQSIEHKLIICSVLLNMASEWVAAEKFTLPQMRNFLLFRGDFTTSRAFFVSASDHN